MDCEKLKYWFHINCKSVMEDIIIFKRQTKDTNIILNQLNKNDIENLLEFENARLRMDGYFKYQRSKTDLIDIINFDVLESLYEDYKLLWNHLNIIEM